MNRRTNPRHVTTLHTRNVPVDTKAAFKAWCARRGYTMEGAVVALLRKAMTDDRPLQVPRGKQTTPQE